MDLVQLAQQQGWTPEEFRSQVVRAAAAIGAMELEQTPGREELVMSGKESGASTGHIELVIRFRSPTSPPP